MIDNSVNIDSNTPDKYRTTIRTFIRSRDKYSPKFRVDQAGCVTGLEGLYNVLQMPEQYNIHHIIPKNYWGDKKRMSKLVNGLGIYELFPYLSHPDAVLNQLLIPVDLHNYINSLHEGLDVHGGPIFMHSCFIFVLFSMMQLSKTFSSLDKFKQYLIKLNLTEQEKKEILFLSLNAATLLQSFRSRNPRVYEDVTLLYKFRHHQAYLESVEA